MKIYDEKKINLNKPFSYYYSYNANDLTSYRSKMNNSSGNYPVMIFGFDDGIETKMRVFTGSIKDGLTINYKYNEDLDNVNIELMDDEDNSNALDFKIPNRSRVKLSIDSGNTYEDYVVVSGNFLEKKINGKKHYFHAYNLVEPIYLLKYVILPNNTFGNLTSIKMYNEDGTSYEITQNATNCYDALVRILKIADIKTSSEDNSWNSRIFIESNTKTKLENSGIGMNYFYNSNSLYNIIFKLFHIAGMYPVLKFNPMFSLSGYEFVLSGIDIDGNGTTISESNAFSNCTSYLVSDTAEQQATKCVANVQNLISSVPTNASYLSLRTAIGEVINDTIDPDTLNNYPIALRYDGNEFESIRIIARFNYRLSGSTSFAGVVDYDRTFDILEYNEWSILSVQSQRKTAYYKDGGIYNIGTILKYSFGTSTNYVDKIIFSNGYTNMIVKYNPVLNGKVSKGNRFGWETSIDQENSSVDSKELGNYMSQYIENYSSVNIQFGKIETSYSNIYKSGTKISPSSYHDLIINDVEVKMHNNYFEVSYNATIGTPIRSDLIGYDSSVENKYIDKSLSVKRDINFVSSYKLCLIQSYTTNNTYFLTTQLNGLLMNKLNINNTYYLKCKMISKNSSYNSRTYNIETKQKIISTAFGNSIIYQIGFDESNYNLVDNYTSAANSTNNTTIEKYCDDFGKIDIMTLQVAYGTNNTPLIESDDKFLINVQNAEIYKDTYEIPNIMIQCDIENGTHELCDYIADNNEDTITSIEFVGANYKNEQYNAANKKIASISFASYRAYVSFSSISDNYNYYDLWATTTSGKKVKLATLDKPSTTNCYLVLINQ